MTSIRKRQLAAGLAILGVAASVGWNLARHPETAARLQDVRLLQHSERTHPGPAGALAGIRIRLSPSGFDEQVLASAHAVPQITVAPE